MEIITLDETFSKNEITILELETARQFYYSGYKTKGYQKKLAQFMYIQGNVQMFWPLTQKIDKASKSLGTEYNFYTFNGYQSGVIVFYDK